MDDPRWDDVRERDDGRARVYDQRDRTEHVPRDGLMHDLDLPRANARELVIDRDRVYELNGEDSRMLAAVGAFRVVPEQDLGTDRENGTDCDTLDHLRDEGLIRTIALGEHERAMVLTTEGRDLLDANRRDRDDGDAQTFHTGVNRPRELDHDAHLYAAYHEEEARIRQEHEHREIRRVITSALKGSRHLRSARFLCMPDGTSITRDEVIKAIRGAQRVAGVPQAGVHVCVTASARISR
jgi:hypothetical protein